MTALLNVFFITRSYIFIIEYEVALTWPKKTADK